MAGVGKLTAFLLLIVLVSSQHAQPQADTIDGQDIVGSPSGGRNPNRLTGEAITIPTKGAPWPQPKSLISKGTVLALKGEDFLFKLTAKSDCDILQSAFTRYRAIIFGAKDQTVDPNTLKFRSWKENNKLALAAYPIVPMLSVRLFGHCTGYPTLDSDESYDLEIGETGEATLIANEVWGALRGLETFSQLVYQENSVGLYVVNASSISDAPRFKHRGLLLDSSRHYLSVHVLKQNLDIMAQNKFNVFHWHIVDDQAFPYESYTFPQMSVLGAYTQRHVYTQQDVKEIIEYARFRGIRVIPEYDTPGHSLSWGKANPGLLTPCYKGNVSTGTFGPINPVPDNTYAFLAQFFAEIANVFPDHFVHLGGDEVPFDCWKSNPDVTAFMKKMGFGTDYSKLEAYYMTKLLAIVNKLKKGYMIWQEVIDNGVKVAPDSVISVWKGSYQAELARVTSLGYKVLLSSPWYLSMIHFGSDWKQYYVVEPLAFNGSAAQKELVMGGETCLWGEYVDDTNVISRLWPRASAIAERLWSPEAVNDLNAAAPRIEEHRCRLIKRGYPAEPINGPGMCEHEYVYSG